MPVRILITEGAKADCKEAVHLIEGISAGALLADRAYDTDEIIAYALAAGIEVVIPPKRNRKEQRQYDRYLYRLRHLVENAFLHLKRCCADSLHRYLVRCFGLISCRYYLRKA